MESEIRIVGVLVATLAGMMLGAIIGGWPV